MGTGIDTVVVTSSDSDERPWYRRSRLYDREVEIRRLQAEGYSLAQIIRRLDLCVSRSYLWRWLRRQRAAAVRPAAEPAPTATPAAPSGAASEVAAAEDAAAEALLSAAEFTPPPKRKSR
jgi:transposase-like protein